MKTKNILKFAAGITLALGVTACSSDYLDLEPEGSISYSQVQNTPEGITLAVHGMCQCMYKQYSALYDYNWFNGEPWLLMYYGEVMGQDYISLFWSQGYSELVNWTQMRLGGKGSQVAWSYCYGIISQANTVLNGIAAPSDWNTEEALEVEYEPEVAFRRAQALTLRAHNYLRLMQIYAPRWQDRKKADGTEKLTIPLRLTYVEPEGDLSCPLATSSQVMNRIYADLDEALRCYEMSGMHRQYDWEPDKQIAQGIYSRAALLKQDWETAQQMAHDARQGYPIMTIDEYRQGFAAPTAGWMWTNSGASQGLYYASFGATYACNGAYPCLWGNIGAGAIDNDLLSNLSAYDNRGALFFGPRNLAGAATRNYFWSTTDCTPSTLNINSKSSALHVEFVKYCEQRYAVYAQEQGWYPPYTEQGYPIHNLTTTVTAQFGAQFKFWGVDGYSASYFPFMRADEMLLNEAEAAWHNNDMATAKALLDEINKARLTRWRNSYTGDALLEQIKLTRRIELWGEGFSWFDWKRWREPIVRTAWVAGNPNSGNWPAAIAGTFDITLNRGWRWRIPSTEYNYNNAIDQNEAVSDDDYMSAEGEPD